jgi:uncharacterized protein YdeI (YjbR/CyaY-like superfamily)
MTPDQSVDRNISSGGHSRLNDALPAELVVALAAAPDAQAAFDALSASHRKEYIRWIAQARRADARERRAAQTIMRLLEQR